MRTITLIFLMAISVSSFAQKEALILKQAQHLIDTKKYQSAFELLDSFDVDNAIPDIVLMKEDIVLNYFVTSMMHKIFALKDLEKGERIEDFRGTDGSFSLFMFDPETILDSLLIHHPKNCKLNRGLGDFYYELHLKYGENGMKSNEELFKLITDNYNKAIEGQCDNFLTHYVLGYLLLLQEKNKESIPFLQKAIAMNKEYASAHYNLAFAYIQTGENEKAIEAAKKSIDLYTDVVYKSDAARIVGQTYDALKDSENAAKYLEMADAINPKNYYNLTSLLFLYAKSNNQKLKALSKKIFDLDPTNPTSYYDLEEAYYSNNKKKELVSFYQEQLVKNKDEDKIIGNIHFFIGRLFIEDDSIKAKEHFLEAKKVFSKTYEEGHPVFEAIDAGIQATQKQK